MNTAENIIPIRGNQQMNNQLPDPPVPADCDLSGFPFMPFDAGRFRDSTFVAESSLEIVGAACILWAAAWCQVPAGSLPDNDASLARMTGFGRDVAGWQKIRAGALYGFEKCSDGRLYHKHLTFHVIEAWERRKKRVSAAAQSWINRSKNKQEQSNCYAEDEHGQSTCNANAELLQSKDHTDNKDHTDKTEKKYTPKPPQSDSEPEKANAAKAASVSVQQVVDLYHDVLPSLPSVLKVTDARRKAINARIRDDLKTIGQWEGYFGKVAPSDFLMGRVDGFRADLEWLCKPANMLKVLEGRYERNQAKPSPPQSKHNGFAQRDYSKGINPDGSF